MLRWENVPLRIPHLNAIKNAKTKEWHTERKIEWNGFRLVDGTKASHNITTTTTDAVTEKNAHIVLVIDTVPLPTRNVRNWMWLKANRTVGYSGMWNRKQNRTKRTSENEHRNKIRTVFFSSLSVTLDAYRPSKCSDRISAMSSHI